MSNTPWLRQGTQEVRISQINAVFQKGNSLSQYFNGNGTFFNPDNGGNQTSTGQRAMSSWLDKSWVYIWGQGGTYGAPNYYTNIYLTQGQGAAMYTAVNLQTNYNCRVFARNACYVNGYGGSGGANRQGYPYNPGASPGQGGISIQGYASQIIVNSQGYTLYGGGGGGGAGNQGSNGPTNQPAGGGSGGGGAGYGAAGPQPDSGRQAQGAQAGFAQAGGAGGWAGTQGPNPSRSGGAGGAAGQAAPNARTGGGGGAPGAPAGTPVTGSSGGTWYY